MKTAGWICLVIGVLSLIGASQKGDSIFGPLFFIGLGAFFLYRANNKEQATQSKPYNSNTIADFDLPAKEDSIDESDKKTTDDAIPNQQMESIEDIQSHLTLQQREAAMCLISFFVGYNNDLMDDIPTMLFKQSAIFFGIPYSPAIFSKIMSKYTNADSLIDIVLSIKYVKAKEFLLLTCYDLSKLSQKSEAYNLLYNIANDMGYDKSKLDNLINLYK